MALVIRSTMQSLDDSPIQWDMARYRSGFHSLIKSAVQEHARWLYSVYFDNSGHVVVKPYTFAVLFSRPKFTNGKVEFKRLDFIFSSNDLFLSTAVYNWLVTHSKAFPLLGSVLSISKIKAQKVPKVSSQVIEVQSLSPVLVRSHENENHYLVPECENHQGDDHFQEALRFNVKQVVKAVEPDLLHSVDSLHLEPVSCKFTVVKYAKNDNMLKFPGFRGKFKLFGTPELLNLLLQVGIGSRRSQGFGMIELLREM